MNSGKYYIVSFSLQDLKTAVGKLHFPIKGFRQHDSLQFLLLLLFECMRSLVREWLHFIWQNSKPQSFIPAATKLWNELPSEVVECNELWEFKVGTNKFLIELNSGTWFLCIVLFYCIYSFFLLCLLFYYLFLPDSVTCWSLLIDSLTFLMGFGSCIE